MPSFGTNEDYGQAEILIQIVPPAPFDFPLRVKLMNGTAVSPDDFDAFDTTFMVYKDDEEIRAPVVVHQDGLTEPTEHFYVQTFDYEQQWSMSWIPLRRCTSTTARQLPCTPSSSVPTCSFRKSPVRHGSGSTVVPPFDNPLEVSYGIEHVTTDSGDLSDNGGSITVPGGTASFPIDVPIFDDAVLEDPQEEFRVHLLPLTLNGVELGLNTTASGFIYDNEVPEPDPPVDPPPDPVDPPPQLEVYGSEVFEGDSGTKVLDFDVFLVGVPTGVVETKYRVEGLSAQPGVDFVPVSQGTLFFNGTFSETVSVTIQGDTFDELDEEIELTLFAPDGATLAIPSAIGTIRDDDDEPRISIGDSSVDEGDGGQVEMVFPISLTNASELPIDIHVMTRDDTASAGEDYVAVDTTVEVPSGALGAHVKVRVAGDTQPEAPETFFVDLVSTSHGLLEQTEATGLILDDDDPAAVLLAVVVDDLEVVEGDGDDTTAEVVFHLETDGTATSGNAPWVDWRTVDASATHGEDYVRANGRVTFRNGPMEHAIVRIVGDDRPEPVETFEIEIVNSSPGVVLADRAARVRILDDDAGQAQRLLTITGARVNEGDEGEREAVFQVLLSEPPQAGELVSVVVTTVDGTAEAGSDYRFRSGTLEFRAGVSEMTFGVPVLGDEVFEPDEEFSVRIENPIGVRLVEDHAVGRIVNDDDPSDPGDDTGNNGGDGDPPGGDDPGGDDPGGDDPGGGGVTLPTIGLVVPETISEGRARVPVRVKLAGPARGPVVARVEIKPITAVAGEDFEPRVTRLEFSGNAAAEQAVGFPLRNDTVVEEDETVRIQLSLMTSGNALLGQANAIVTILDDDKGVRLSAKSTELEATIHQELELGVVVLGEDDRPIEGAPVTWKIEPGQLLGKSGSRSDERGRATQRVRMPERPGLVSVRARLDDTEQVVAFRIAVMTGLGELFDDERSPDESSVGDALDGRCEEATGQLEDFCEYLVELPDDGARREVVEALTPGNAQIKGDTALQAVRVQTRNVAARLAQLRAGRANNGIDGLGVDIRGTSVSAGQMRRGLSPENLQTKEERIDGGVERALQAVRAEAGLEGQSEATEIAATAAPSESAMERLEQAGSAARGVPRDQAAEQQFGGAASADEQNLLEEQGESRFGFFVNGRLAVGEHKKTAFEPGYDLRTRGLTGGVDYRVARNGYLGLALGYLDSNSELRTRSGELDTSGFTFTLYTGWQWQNFYIDGSASHGMLEFDMMRRIVLPAAFEGQSSILLTGDTDSDVETYTLGLGYDTHVGALALTGFARGLHNDTGIDPFVERGPSLFALTFSDQQINSNVGRGRSRACLPGALPLGRAQSDGEGLLLP